MFDEARNDGGFVAVGGEDRGACDWREVDRQLRRIAKRRAGLDAEEARWLLAAQRAEVHLRFGHVTFAEYVERVLGYSPKTCGDRLRVATSLEGLPAMWAALARGDVSYSSVRELTRVATPATEDAWLARARGKTVREIEQLVTGHEPGDDPDDPTDPDLRPHVLRFELSPHAYALYREAERVVRARVGRLPTDDEIFETMSLAVLAPATGDADDSNTPPYQIALTRCVECDRAWQDGAGVPVEVGPEVVAMAACDAQTIGRVDGNTRERASRTIPPALRRQVLRRDHNRCIVPGCRATRHLNVHHLDERQHGGANEAENLATLCFGHHRRLHLGAITITGTPGHREFYHRDGSPWGTPRSSAPTWAAVNESMSTTPVAPTAPTVEATPVASPSEARAALRQLGFTTAESAAAVAHALARVGAHSSIEQLLAAALRACRTSAARS